TENTVAEALVQELARDGTCRHAHGGFPRGGTAAATVIAETVFLHIGVVGVTGTEGARDLGVILAALVGVLDQQADRGAGGLALEYAGQDLHGIRFATLGGVAAGAGLAAVQFALQVFLGQRQAGRTAIDDGTQGRAVGFTEGGDAEKFAEAVACHTECVLKRGLSFWSRA